MKPVLKPFIIARPDASGTAAGLAIFILLGASFAVEAQSKGYLSKTGPSGLRFSSPPKPPVLSLNAHPGTYTPPSVFVTEFATATNAIPAAQSKAVLLFSPAPTPLAPEPSGHSPTNRTKVVERPAESNDLSFQVLVKYFADKKSNPSSSSLKEPIAFLLPAKDTNSPSALTRRAK